MSFRALFRAAAVLGYFALVVPCSGQDHIVREQRVFSSEDTRVNRPITLPESAIKVLCLSIGEPAECEIAEDKVSASTIHLKDRDEVAFVVFGTHVLRGPHNVQFWIVEQRSEGYRVILSAVGDVLTVAGTRYHGYRLIRVANILTLRGEINTTTYRFDKDTYKEARARTSSYAR